MRAVVLLLALALALTVPLGAQVTFTPERNVFLSGEEVVVRAHAVGTADAALRCTWASNYEGWARPMAQAGNTASFAFAGAGNVQTYLRVKCDGFGEVARLVTVWPASDSLTIRAEAGQGREDVPFMASGTNQLLTVEGVGGPIEWRVLREGTTATCQFTNDPPPSPTSRRIYAVAPSYEPGRCVLEAIDRAAQRIGRTAIVLSGEGILVCAYAPLSGGGLARLFGFTNDDPRCPKGTAPDIRQ